MSETVIVRCRLCNKPMNVPKSIMMVFTFDPSVCNQCRGKTPKGLWDTADDNTEKETETCQERFKRLWQAGYEGHI
jgi:hypothetical protein